MYHFRNLFVYLLRLCAKCTWLSFKFLSRSSAWKIHEFPTTQPSIHDAIIRGWIKSVNKQFNKLLNLSLHPFTYKTEYFCNVIPRARIINCFRNKRICYISSDFSFHLLLFFFFFFFDFALSLWLFFLRYVIFNLSWRVPGLWNFSRVKNHRDSLNRFVEEMKEKERWINWARKISHTRKTCSG